MEKKSLGSNPIMTYMVGETKYYVYPGDKSGFVVRGLDGSHREIDGRDLQWILIGTARPAEPIEVGDKHAGN